MRFKPFILLFILHPILVKAQQNIIPPAPEASQVFKFTEAPANIYNGMINTTIQLFEIKSGNITIPINISYHSRGLKIEEISSRVGTGWSLNYGGMISRQIRDQADDGTSGYLDSDWASYVFTDKTRAGQLYQSDLNNPVDFQPDVFMFDFPGASGKFILDQTTKEVLQQKYSDIKFQYARDSIFRINQWIVTDKDGTKYYFGKSFGPDRRANEFDMSIANYSFASAMASLGTSGDRMISTWHLMEIHTTTNDTIRFNYDLNRTYIWRRQYDKNYVPPSGAISFFGRSDTWQYDIKEIVFKNGKIKFTSGVTEREDANGYPLEKVELFDNNDSLIKRFTFKYSYRSTVNDNNQLQYLKSIDPKSSKRMFLETLQESGKNNDTLPPYRFIYSEQLLPNRFSTSQDIWGYYNGKNNGSFLTFFNYSTNDINREVDTVKSECGLLKKIVYPSGGHTSFVYEHNRGVLPPFMSELATKHIIPDQTSGDAILPGPGKRIKRVEYRTPENVLASFKEYEYVSPVTGAPTGRILGLPNFYYKMETVVLNGDTVPVVGFLGSVPGSPLSNAQGNSIGYNSVTEYYGDSSNNMGKVEHSFTLPDDSGQDYYKFPFTFPIDNEWLRGKPIMEKVFERVNTSYRLKKQTDYKYLYAGEFEFDGPFTLSMIPVGPFAHYTIDKKVFRIPSLIWYKENIDSLIKVSYQTGGAFDLQETIVTEYGANNSDISIYSGSEFNYDKHYLPIASKTVNAKGDTVKVRTYFPPDLSTRTSAEQKLLDLNRFSSPVIVETSTYQTDPNTILSKQTQKFEYRDWGNNIVLPEFVKSSINENPLKTDLHFVSYNENGKPLEMIERNGIRNSIIWGYNGEYPVARISNSNYAAASSFVDLQVLKNANNYSDHFLRMELNKIRTGLSSSKALVTTFTYKPLIGMSSQTNELGNSLHYIYDNLSRLTLIRDKDSNIIKKVNYSYSGNNGGTVNYYSEERIKVFTRNNCGTGIGGQYTYTVPAGMFTSVISQADANQKANNYLIQNGQVMANSNASCTYKNVAKSASFSKNNCSGGAPGTFVIYSVLKDTYTSNINQQDADQKAIDDINANGQNYANAHGACAIPIYATLEGTGFGIPEPHGKCVEIYDDFTISFYQDAAKTIPYIAANFQVPITRTATAFTNGSPGTPVVTTTTYIVSGSTYDFSHWLIFNGCKSGTCPPGQICFPGPNDPSTQTSYSVAPIIWKLP